MWIKVIIALLMIGLINASIAATNQEVYRAAAKRTNATQIFPTSRQQQPNSNSSQIATPETLEAAPTITSVHHQVWTSSSSGRLDELSPEVISKLRNDVPFLAAYALRPRLVGGPASMSAADIAASIGGQQAGAAEKLVSARYDASVSNEPRLASVAAPTNNGMPLEVDASSPRGARQSLVPKLGDFSEFNVETSSLSKSEHHHKRKTSLKRPKSGKNDGGRQLISSSRLGRTRATAEDSLSQLVKKVKKAQDDKQRRSSAKRLRSKRKRNTKPKRRSKSKRKSGKRRRGSRRSRSSNRRRTSSRNARFLQEQTVGANDLNDDTRSLANGGSFNTNDSSGVKGGSTKGGGDVKGGGPGNAPKKPPFFAAGQRPDQMAKSPRGGGEAEADRSLDNDNPNAIDARNNDSSVDDVLDDDAEIDDEPQAEPRRVGDDDVEEDGDTVLVEPKSDGVDDDPPLPDSPEDADEADGTDGQSGTGRADEDGVGRDREEPTTTPSPVVPEGDPRGNRVNRQKPNELPSADDRSRSARGDEGDAGQAAGGGIGATVGGGSSDGTTSTGGGGNGSDDDGSEFGVDDRRDLGSPKGKGGPEPGVEFAEDERSSRGNSDDSQGTREPTVGRGVPDDSFDDDRRTSTGSGASDGDFGERRPSEGSRDTGLDGRRPTSSVDGDDREDDLDYRDEIERAGPKNPAATNGGMEMGREPNLNGGSPTTGVNATRDHSKTDVPVHCDDGSYDHHGDHHGDHHHHSHHDTIDWLRGAVPGEPDDDYPILSRVNVTNFSCADQKHPGYYADVDARCQIFHICQADGRQDSFLCPNGTIFSQKSLVCVWWNGFHCEDAPKFYHLNELLYKTTNGNESPQAAALPNLRPLDGAHPRPRSMKAADEDDSPIDGMMEATKRGRGPQEAGFMGGHADGGLARGQTDARSNIGPDDDATIQRKSTNLDDDSIDEPPARLRARDHVPRRRRRASISQAPPKLKSRRVSRNSRRRKLRHGIKPRRRA